MDEPNKGIKNLFERVATELCVILPKLAVRCGQFNNEADAIKHFTCDKITKINPFTVRKKDNESVEEYNEWAKICEDANNKVMVDLPIISTRQNLLKNLTMICLLWPDRMENCILVQGCVTKTLLAMKHVFTFCEKLVTHFINASRYIKRDLARFSAVGESSLGPMAQSLRFIMNHTKANTLSRFYVMMQLKCIDFNNMLLWNGIMSILEKAINDFKDSGCNLFQMPFNDLYLGCIALKPVNVHPVSLELNMLLNTMKLVFYH